MKNKTVSLLVAAFAVILSFNIHAAAQSSYSWLDDKPLPSWNSRSRAILEAEKMPASEIAQCRKFVRQPTSAADKALAKFGWTLVGPAQVYGNTTVVSWAVGFDGQCRPRKFQTLVFVGNRVAGTLSPGPMDSRTDGALVNVKMTSETTLTAEYARYKSTDALCCPYKIEAVTFVIKPDGANFLLTPESKIQTGLVENQAEKTAASFINRVWKVNKSNNVTAGQIYVFISDGTLAITSPNSKPAFGSWTYKDGNLTMVEESRPYKVDILKLSKDEFNIKINDSGEGVEIEFVPATESEATR